MTWDPRKPGKIGAGLTAVVLMALLPAAARAEALTFRNDTNAAIIVQGACVVRGVMRRDRPYLLKPGDATPGITLPGNKLITVYDAFNPNKVIYQGTIPHSPTDQLFSVVPESLGGGVKVDPVQTPDP